jgi:DNA-binding transcriptional LysR family regulator
VRTERFLEDELVLITPLHFEADRLSTRELAASTLLLREHGSGSRRVVESALEKAGLKLKSFRRVMELDSTEAIKSAVEAGLGVGFVSRWAISKELDLGVLKSIPVDRIRVTRQFTLISRIGPESQGPTGALRTFVLGCARLLSNRTEKSFSGK